MSTISLFKDIENNHYVYRGKDCMKKFWEFLRQHAMKIINFEKKIMKLLTKEHQESHENVKIWYICKKNWKAICERQKSYKFKDCCHYPGE